jgi:predicted nucleotidyltransferase
MKVLGIITEYNPFHNGHLYHLNRSLELSNADYTVCVMSGNFVQRGKPAIINKWDRSMMALKAGVDLILELPTVYSLRSAEYFAYGSVQTLNKTGIVDELIFGSELGEINPLIELGEVLAKEPEELSNLIQTELKSGSSFPEARANALAKYFANQKKTLEPEQVKSIINNPNNILGIEYIKALFRTNSEITPSTIERQGANYHQSKVKGRIASATAIRKKIIENQSIKPLNNVLATYSQNILKKSIQNEKAPISLNNFELPLLTILRRTTTNELKKIEGISGGLENRIKDAAHRATSLLKLISLIETRRFTRTRIQRILMHLLLNLKEELLNKFDNNGGPQYLRILAFSKKGQQLLSLIKENSKVPIINRLANHYKSHYPPNSLKKEMLAIDIKASDIYALAYNNPKFRQGGSDYTQPIILKN